jgi:hypothetical protein
MRVDEQDDQRDELDEDTGFDLEQVRLDIAESCGIAWGRLFGEEPLPEDVLEAAVEIVFEGGFCGVPGMMLALYVDPREALADALDEDSDPRAERLRADLEQEPGLTEFDGLALPHHRARNGCIGGCAQQSGAREQWGSRRRPIGGAFAAASPGSSGSVAARPAAARHAPEGSGGSSAAGCARPARDSRAGDAAQPRTEQAVAKEEVAKFGPDNRPPLRHQRSMQRFTRTTLVLVDLTCTRSRTNRRSHAPRRLHRDQVPQEALKECLQLQATSRRDARREALARSRASGANSRLTQP